jgi:hypothetical protein
VWLPCGLADGSNGMNTTILRPRIVCAALKHIPSGAIICGPRHYDMRMLEQIMNSPHDWKQSAGVLQGFVDAWGDFLTRDEAWFVAKEHGQIIKDADWFSGNLHSEHLY